MNADRQKARFQAPGSRSQRRSRQLDERTRRDHRMRMQEIYERVEREVPPRADDEPPPRID